MVKTICDKCLNEVDDFFSFKPSNNRLAVTNVIYDICEECYLEVTAFILGIEYKTPQTEQQGVSGGKNTT